MTTPTHSLVLDPALLRRGFWLYVWHVTSEDGRELLYVGRTGDEAYVSANPPFKRMGQHLDPKSRANMLYRHLVESNVDPLTCGDLRMIAHGPLFFEVATKDQHRPRRDVTAALEKQLAVALAAGYTVMNTVHCQRPLCWCCWQGVRQAFLPHFPKIGGEQPVTSQPCKPCFQHAEPSDG